ncbi:chitobiase/beta-hexosaminidase C-terminal domain-containing protein [Myxococcus sp. K38C18041901]|uniref:chitobiase/beta-hexosaminidase C-terminal domain-containing protein n=1 Tax=Myxococcus guangdongensis TaxID=2906760 RepID=UPI0020A7C9D1|nr:chitobiase/beta-hexosaminidase C-terminal domain-containing protein [Myxococcus guangdongensis]MCP3058628.1 chitobiase/beta-hexosaminidase C-terminal domain-containing protein [Myxococcus guangdongensis]
MSRHSSRFRAPRLLGVLTLLMVVSACGGGGGGPGGGGREDGGGGGGLDAGPDAGPDGGPPPTPDTTPPTTAFAPVGGLFKGPTTVVLTCDDGSGVGCEATYYTLDGSAPTASSPRYTAALRLETTARLRVLSVDRAGNAEEARSAEYVIDAQPPTVSSTPRSGAYGNDRTVTLSCDDGAGSGCVAIYFTRDGSAPSTASLRYSSPLSLPGSGTLRVRFLAVDRAGHLSKPGDEQFVVDTKPPVTTASPPWGSYGEPIHVTLSCSDTGGGGCARIHYTRDGTAPTTSSPVYERPLLIESPTRVRFFSVDVAGNQETPLSFPFVVDTAPPVTQASPAGGTFNGGTTVYLYCNDGSEGSGCASTYVSFAADASAPVPPYQRVTGQTAVVSSGVLRFYSVDAVGHAGPVQMVTFLIDRTKPTVSVAPRGGTFFTPQTVTLTCEDTGGSDCAHIYYTVDGSWPHSFSPRYTRPLDLSKDTMLRFFAVDGADNSSEFMLEQYVFRLDTTAPTTVASPAGGLFREAQPVTLVCGDGEGIGCSSTRYTLDGSEPTESNGFTYSGPISLATTTRLRFRSVDALGQWEAPRQAEYVFDMDVPKTQVEPPGGTFEGPLFVRLACQDVGSGCAETRYTVDGTEPTSSSPYYVGPIPVGQTTTVRFASVDEAGNVEATRRETYNLDASTLASAQLASLRTSPPSAGQPRLVDGAFITYVKPAVGTTRLEPEGFFLQAEKVGPAVFVEVPLASLAPAPVAGDRVRVLVTQVRLGTMDIATIDVASFAVLGSGYPMKVLAQEVSGINLPSNSDSYEAELVSIRGQLIEAFASDGVGTGFSSTRLVTSGVPSSSTSSYSQKLRMPELALGPELTPGCTVSITTPLWRSGAAYLTVWKWELLDSVVCPLPRVLFAQALDGSQVQVRFDRRIDASSLDSAGGQFSIPGLLVTGATLHGPMEVRLQTSTQASRGHYRVTVSETLTDRLGAPVRSPSNTYAFRGYATPARLRLSEIDPSRSSGAVARVELEVLQAGPMTNLALWKGHVATPVATLPDVDVAVGDIVVVHLVEEGFYPKLLPRSEVSRKDEVPSSTHALAHDSAWDVRGSNEFTVEGEEAVLRLTDSFGNLQDGLILHRPGFSRVGFEAEAHALQDEQGWLPASCGGVRCTSASSPRLWDISANIGPLFGTGGATQSLTRVRVEDSDSAVDWALRTQGVGLPNL